MYLKMSNMPSPQPSLEKNYTTRGEFFQHNAMQTKSSNILAIILNWNETEQTLCCIASLLSQNEVKCDILLIDNNSLNFPCHIFEKRYPFLNIIQNESNLGVAGGRNIGINYALKNGYEYILLFDNDAVADHEMICHLLNSAKHNLDIGIFGPKIMQKNCPSKIWRAGCTSWTWVYLHSGHQIIKSFCSFININIPLRIDKERGNNQYDTGQYDNEENIDFQIGCAQFIRNSVFEKIGILDEMFSPYGSEDIDFCVRAMEAGYKIRYVPSSVCWHRTENNFNDNYKRSFNNCKNIILLARKHMSPLYFTFIFLPDFILCTTPLVLTRDLLGKKAKKIKGYIDAIRWHCHHIKNHSLLL